MTTQPPRPEPTDASAVDWDAEEESLGAWEGPRRTSSTARRRWWVLGAVAVVLMSALAVWWGVSATSDRVHWVQSGHEVIDDGSVDVRFDLRRDPSRSVVCELEAQDYGHTVVGRREVTVPPGTSSPSRHVERVATATRSVTGYVETCWYADEAPRRH